MFSFRLFLADTPYASAADIVREMTRKPKRYLECRPLVFAQPTPEYTEGKKFAAILDNDWEPHEGRVQPANTNTLTVSGGHQACGVVYTTWPPMLSAQEGQTSHDLAQQAYQTAAGIAGTCSGENLGYSHPLYGQAHGASYGTQQVHPNVHRDEERQYAFNRLDVTRDVQFAPEPRVTVDAQSNVRMGAVGYVDPAS
ncbi:uncharacterized protein B0H18DRAFT_953057 [Fomitopsis serialis]|uniref:uncharacterized protein n=1 Tax=Fomitopsis serialis TaxID=139415 RepID=UPI0020078405|nr:uncharacterized protein B0H18DRAFT_953057 [Neoantrodia serialis]KAH9930648.1 hypothetical protein B0H18DRAFT_953057 [Neoantrodia serialis]